jgi:peptide/nickel transport system ATP-binding protein
VIRGLVKGPEALRIAVGDALTRVGLTRSSASSASTRATCRGRSSAPYWRARSSSAELLVADEPVSMLDMSVRAKIPS